MYTYFRFKNGVNVAYIDLFAAKRNSTYNTNVKYCESKEKYNGITNIVMHRS